MKTHCSTSNQTGIEELYREYSERIFNYIASKIDSREDAENLAQDVWIKLLESGTAIYKETALPLLYRVAVNLVNDYLRKLYVRNGSREEVSKLYTDETSVTPQHEYEAMELAMLEAMMVECLPPQRRTIYTMSRFDDMAVADIADKLQLSFRTVENHLRMGRRDVRNYISAIA